MKLIKCKCEGCGALLKISEDIKKAQCNYCGAKFLIDDGNITYTHKKIDEAKIKDIEVRDKIHERELKFKEQEEKRNYLFITLLFVALAMLMFLMAIPSFNDITMPKSAKEYKGDNYKEIIRELENMGFKNIETIKKEDLITGWINKDGDIEKISINGVSNFKEGDIFEKRDEVIITYHTFKK